MLYTRKGDTGSSGLWGTKERVPKGSPIYDALGTLDELNSLLGFCYASACGRETVPAVVPLLLRTVQQHLFIVQAELAGTQKSLAQTHVEELEHMIDRMEQHIQRPHAFMLPGATELSALFDYARAVARRAERAVIRAQDVRVVSPATRSYLNRLSSLLYALARTAAASEGKTEESPTY